jgi:hypothetical protein
MTFSTVSKMFLNRPDSKETVIVAIAMTINFSICSITPWNPSSILVP